MSLSDCQEAIPLRVSSRKRQIAGGAERLCHAAFIPEPTAGDLIFAAAHVAVITDGVLVINDGGDAAERALECSGDGSGPAASSLSGSGNQKCSAAKRTLHVEYVNRYRI